MRLYAILIYVFLYAPIAFIVGGSFNAEAEPLVVEIEGQTRRLTGTAEERYQEWRRLLREIYSTETGTPGIDSAEAAVVSPPAG